MEKTIIELRMFIVPNQGARIDQLIRHSSVKRRLELLGVPHQETSKCLQVWIHDEHNDNLTDHGLDDRLRNLLGVDPEDHYVHAPDFFPVDELKKATEGGILEYTSKNGSIIHIKCEQLPYRYRRFGKFEDVVEMVSRRTDENITWLDEMAAKRAEKKGA